MRAPHLIVGVLTLATAVTGIVALVVDPGPFADDSSTMIAVGLAIGAIVSLAGLLLARAPWGRFGATAVVLVAMFLSALGGTGMVWVTVALGAAALVGLYGPWLGLWLRKGRVVDAPGPIPITLTSVGALAFFVIGIAAWEGTDAAHWAAAATATIAAVLYGRGNRLGLWLLRTAVPVLAMWAAVSTPLPAAMLLVAGGILVGIAAWLPAARRTTTVITPPLPEPVRRTS